MVQDCLAFILNYGHWLILKTVKKLHLTHHKKAFQPISPSYFLTPSKKNVKNNNGTYNLYYIFHLCPGSILLANSLRNFIKKKIRNKGN